jgi:hypothetical protein
MHLRGKDFELRVVTPDKKMTTVLKGNWNFEWQMGYQYAEPIALPKGSKLQFITHFDNSPANKFNPDPTKKIVWGPQNWDEMSNCFIGVLFPTSTAPEKGVPAVRPELCCRAARADRRWRRSRWSIRTLWAKPAMVPTAALPSNGRNAATIVIGLKSGFGASP